MPIKRVVRCRSKYIVVVVVIVLAFVITANMCACDEIKFRSHHQQPNPGDFLSTRLRRRLFAQTCTYTPKTRAPSVHGHRHIRIENGRKKKTQLLVHMRSRTFHAVIDIVSNMCRHKMRSFVAAAATRSITLFAAAPWKLFVHN